MIASKLCARCKQELPVSEFRKQSDSSDGLQSYCKLCLSEYKKSKYKTAKAAKSYSSYKVAKCKHSKIRLLFGEGNQVVTFRVLAEMLNMTVKQVYTRWDLRGRPCRIKSLEFFNKDYAVERRKRIKRSTETLAKYRAINTKATYETVKEVKVKPVKKKRAEGNAEWQALSDDPR